VRVNRAAAYHGRLLRVKQVEEKFEVLCSDTVTSYEQKQLKHQPLYCCKQST